MTKKRALVIPLITLVILTALSALASPAFADGGDFSTDFIAAGPFTYDHDTGIGGTYDDRTISKTDGVVESLEGGDFACGDLVVYFAAVTVEADATGEQDIELDVGFLAEPTGQPGVGHRDLISASPNTDDDPETDPDTGFEGEWQDTTASIKPGTEKIDESGAHDELVATISINNLDPGEVFILRLVVELRCIFDSDPTGNLQGEIHAGRVVEPEEDAIPIGNQTVPFQSLSAISQPASVSVSVGACPAPGSPTRPVTVDISPPGSATVTITGPGGPYVVVGDGDTLDLEPGNYSWSAEAEEGFILEGPTSGEFTVGSCPRIPASVTLTVGACPQPGSETRPVTVVISPAGSATVTIEGPGGPYVVDGDGDTLDLPVGSYTWTAVADDEHELDVSSGEFTVAACPRIPASVTVEVGPCPAPGSPTQPVTVTIDGPVTVTIEGPGGPYVVTETDTLDLPAGDYTWTAEVPDTHSLDVDSGQFTVEGCPAIEASVLVTVGACPATSSATRPVDVTIGPDGGANVTITGPNGFNQVVTGEGAALDLAPGDYAWSAVANPTYEIIGASSGTFAVGSCIVEVLPKKELPATGAAVTGLGAAGLGFLMLGLVLVSLSRRPSPALAGIRERKVVLERLSGRLALTAPSSWWTLLVPGSSRTRFGPALRMKRKRGGGGST